MDDRQFALFERIGWLLMKQRLVDNKRIVYTNLSNSAVFHSVTNLMEIKCVIQYSFISNSFD